MTHWRKNEFDHIYSERYSGDPDWNVPMRKERLNFHFLGTFITFMFAFVMMCGFIWRHL